MPGAFNPGGGGGGRPTPFAWDYFGSFIGYLKLITTNISGAI